MKKCPTCGNSMIRVIQKCIWHYEDKRFILKDNEFNRCNACGLEFQTDNQSPRSSMDRATDF